MTPRRLRPRALRSSLCGLAASTLLAVTAAAADVTYGTLAPGALSVAEQTDVHCELCRDHLFDPRHLPDRLPEGYRVLTAAEYAKDDPALARWLERHPRYTGFAVGSLCFMSSGSFVVDGVRAHEAGATPMAFWWARAAATPAARPDSAMQGRMEWLQLASWYARTGTDSTRIRRTDPMARFADLEVVKTGRDAWRMVLDLPGERLEATVKGRGNREPRKSAQPGFMTVPFTGSSADRFTVFTYFGHHHQDATGRWRARGSGVFSESLALPGEATVFGTFYQDGWQARSALYPFRP
jgi:hypothetical protein